ncbi:MAG: hypothetical protein ACJARX_001704, partial [Psychroserpens sp.]
MKYSYLLSLLLCLIILSCKTEPKEKANDAMETNANDLVAKLSS